MRFAYIDSQGKEVSIPSVDALRLRIELGAITETTEFFDSGTGKWAPAGDHEIYRTLRRELDGEGEGFVAPPPPSFEAAPPASEVPAEFAPEPNSPTEEPVVSADEPETDEPIVEWDALAPDPGRPAEESSEPEGFDTDLGSDFGELTLEEPGGVVEQDEPEAAASPPMSSDPDDLDFSFGDLTVADDDGDDESEPFEDESAVPDDEFDLGGFGTLELADDSPASMGAEDAGPTEDTAADDTSEGWDVASEFGSPGSRAFEQDAAPGEGVGLGEEPETASWLSDDLPESDSSADEASGTWTSSADEENPFGEAPPALDEGPLGDDGLPVREVSEPDAPRSRPRSAPPKRKLTPAKSSSGIGKLVAMVVAALVVGGGAWFGFQTIAGGGGGDDAAVVDLPEIPETLEPQLRQLAARASSAMVERMKGLPERAAIPEAPPAEWLRGEYLANASRYPSTVDYWNAYSDLLREVRARDDQFFAEAFAAETAAANVAATNATLLTDRAIAGFEAAERDRRLVYEQLENVIRTSLELHQFLLENETNIDYEPADLGSGVSRDPVLEAVPVTEALREEMWAQVTAITQALDDLGYLDRVNTEAFLAVFFEKLQVTGIR